MRGKKYCLIGVVFILASVLTVLAQQNVNITGITNGFVGSCSDVQACFDNGQISPVTTDVLNANTVNVTTIDATNPAGTAVAASASGGTAINASTTGGIAVNATSSGGGAAVNATNTGGGIGVSASTTGGLAIIGSASAPGACAIDGIASATTGATDAIRGTTSASNLSAHGVIGVAGGGGGGVGVQGNSGAGIGVRGIAGAGVGVQGDSTGIAVRGATTGNSDGISGSTNLGSGTAGVRGFSSASGGNGGIFEANTGASAFGVWGRATVGMNRRAGFFSGDVQVVNTLTKGGGGFKIDHPLDPENKYLVHSFVESPDMKNVYDGVVTLDAAGEAWVRLPEYFGAVNSDFRYQLTSIGGFQTVYIAEEISGNRFKISGGNPNGKVSWQVTGIRQDPFAQKYRLDVEEPKPIDDRGYYLHPELYGQPQTRQLQARIKGLLEQNQTDK